MLKLKLFGSFHSSLQNQDLELSFRTNKIKALLAYLTLYSRENHTREKLSTLFWGDKTDSLARKNLRLAFFRMRKEIDQVGQHPLSNSIFLANNQAIQLTPNAVLCDVTRFQQLISNCENHAHHNIHLCTTCLSDLRAAAALYQGDLLQGIHIEDSPSFEEWLIPTREKLRLQAQNVLDTLIESYQRQQRYELVREYSQQLLTFEPWRESAHRQLIIALAKGGHRGAAMAQYRKCKTILRDELGAEPSRETEELIEKIKRGTEIIEISPPSHEKIQPYAAAPSNLPARMTSIFGREQAVSKVISFLDDPHRKLITLLGEGGIGKSRLSLEVGERLRLSFKDGVWFVPLVGISKTVDSHTLEERIATAICESLAIPLKGNDSPQDRLIKRISTEHRLLILDNFEHILDGAGLLIRLLENSPKLKILVSSRQRLGFMAETIFAMTPLSLPEKGLANIEAWEQNPAVALFLERAERVTGYSLRGNQEVQEQITSLCHMLHGIPLAIELAAAGLYQHSLDELLDSIKASYAAVSTSFRDFPDRHRSLRAVFDSAWHQLTKDEKLAFARCTVFRGGFDKAAVFAVVDRSAAHINGLLEKSLLQIDENGQYTIHELVRQFGAEQLSQTETAEIEVIHSNYYLNFVANRLTALVGPRPQESVSEITPDLDNIRLAWDKCIELQNFETLSAAVEPLSIYYEIRGYYREASKVFGDAAAHLEKLAQNRPLMLWLRAHQMRAKVRLAEYAASIEQLTALIPQADATDEPNISCTMRISLAEILWRQGQYSEATEILNKVIDISRVANLPEMETSAHYHIGTLSIFTGEQDVSSTNLQKAQAYWRKIQNHRRLAQALNNEGVLYYHNDVLESAQEVLEEALAINNEIDDTHANLNILINLGNIAQQQGALKKSRGYWQQLLKNHASSGEIYAFSLTLLNIGHSYILEGSYEKAQEYLEEARCLIKNKYPLLKARTIFYFGLVNKKKGNFVAAQQEFERAINIASNLNDTILISQIEEKQKGLSPNNLLESPLT